MTPRTGTTSRTTRSAAQWIASGLLLAAAATQVPLVAKHLEEAPYIGILFIALSVVCVALAATIR